MIDARENNVHPHWYMVLEYYIITSRIYPVNCMRNGIGITVVIKMKSENVDILSRSTYLYLSGHIVKFWSNIETLENFEYLIYYNNLIFDFSKKILKLLYLILVWEGRR